MPTPPIALVFTDLDNTLYDWVAWYSRAFYRLLDMVAARSDIPRAQLLEELPGLYRSRHRLEEPEALLHAPSIVHRFGDPAAARTALRGAFAAYYHSSTSNGLRSYPGVAAALQRMASMGVAVIGHTEAPANHAVARLYALGLEHAFATLLAAPAALDDPTTFDQDPSALPFSLRCLAPHERKPNPDVVVELCRSHGVPPHLALYVGDSLGRDVRMARSAGLRTAWARYGTRHDPRDWQRVVDLSPWTEAQRAQARREVPAPESTPDVVLQETFGELLEHFDFAPQAVMGSLTSATEHPAS